MRSTVDVAIVGGGPAGSTCARELVRGGARVVVIDRATFPRVKLCAGWLSAGVWDVMQLAPQEYPRSLWEWNVCHVHYRGRDHEIRGKGWFIRRYELDDFLLQRSGAELRLGVHVRSLERGPDGDYWTLELPGGEQIAARHVVGAAGTHCPVARMLAPSRPRRALGVQELELQADPVEIERTRLGRNGEPELVLFDDGGGYGWSVPKSGWLNVGCGTLDATAVHGAWRATRDHLSSAGHLPAKTEVALEHAKGHSYFLYAPEHLQSAARQNVLLVGDALGLAHPVTGEGILPAMVSGLRAAEAIVAGEPDRYPARLAADPVIADYDRVARLLDATRAVKRTAPRLATGWLPAFASDLGSAAIARGFGWMFSGARIPLPRVVDRVVDRVLGQRVLGQRVLGQRPKGTGS